MLYRFVKIAKKGAEGEFDVKRIGNIDHIELEKTLQTYLNGGYSLAEAEEWDAQVIKGAAAGMVADPNLPTSGPVEA